MRTNTRKPAKGAIPHRLESFTSNGNTGRDTAPGASLQQLRVAYLARRFSLPPRAAEAVALLAFKNMGAR
jgi:hypothetical protein